MTTCASPRRLHVVPSSYCARTTDYLRDVQCSRVSAVEHIDTFVECIHIVLYILSHPIAPAQVSLGFTSMPSSASVWISKAASLAYGPRWLPPRSRLPPPTWHEKFHYELLNVHQRLLHHDEGNVGHSERSTHDEEIERHEHCTLMSQSSP